MEDNLRRCNTYRSHPRPLTSPYTIRSNPEAQLGANRSMSRHMVASERVTSLLPSPRIACCFAKIISSFPSPSCCVHRRPPDSTLRLPALPAFFLPSFANSPIHISTKLGISLSLSLSLSCFFLFLFFF